MAKAYFSQIQPDGFLPIENHEPCNRLISLNWIWRHIAMTSQETRCHWWHCQLAGTTFWQLFPGEPGSSCSPPFYSSLFWKRTFCDIWHRFFYGPDAISVTLPTQNRLKNLGDDMNHLWQWCLIMSINLRKCLITMVWWLFFCLKLSGFPCPLKSSGESWIFVCKFPGRRKSW